MLGIILGFAIGVIVTTIYFREEVIVYKEHLTRALRIVASYEKLLAAAEKSLEKRSLKPLDEWSRAYFVERHNEQ